MLNARSVLKGEAKKLANELRNVPGLRIKTKFDPVESYTRGFACAVAAWSGFPSVVLYLDRAAGSDRFRFWVGFETLSSVKLDRLLAALPKSEMPTRVVTESDARELASGDWVYKNPKESWLGRPYVERWAEHSEYFFGFYDWGGHATDQLALDTFKATQLIRYVVEKVGRGEAKRNGRRTIVDIETKAAVENEAIKAVKRLFVQNGFKVDESRQADNCGWDLDVTKPGVSLKAEVKGLSGNGLTVELSPNEFDVMSNDPDYRVCIVSNALSQKLRKVRVFRPSGSRWINDDGESLDVQERIAARLTVTRE